MTALPLVLATALALGALHAFDPDHLAAVTVFITRRTSAWGAWAAAGFAVRWAMGHSATLIVAGLASTLFRLALTPRMRIAAELAVGVMLVAVGGWALAGVRRAHLARRDAHHADHPHHAPHARHGEGSSIFWVGALHGLAGSAGLFVIIPVALMSSVWAMLAYVVTFSVGVTVAMSLYAMAVGGLFGKVAGGAGARWYPWLAGAAGSMTLLLGLGWISLTLVARASS